MSSEHLLYTTVIAVALSLGYYVGRTTKPVNGTYKESRTPSRRAAENMNSDTKSMPTSSEDVDISGLDVGLLDECKMVLVVRTDLNMSTGKIAAQHATLACYKTLLSSNPAFLRQWERTGQTKIVLKCYSEEELLTLQAQAQSLNLCARSIQDAGRTQIAAGSRTVLGIAGSARLVNRITGTLRLL
ncbi:PTH2-domain-containing protein [Lentinula aff. detonsa]|uniref:peptidyl-tRNA hydrolase n=1 Tax=Lentinula aff. detonsa TaxID=2804958 RepID=A0AA38U726_9AGAR|nr:PTH2-domain-containing protein [Lentinula aff. detonsa]